MSGAAINQINDIQNSIVSAVEEQTATTNEIGRNVAEAAKGSAEIAQNITGVAQGAQTTIGANDMMKAAEALADMAEELRTMGGTRAMDRSARSSTSPHPIGSRPKPHLL